MFGWTIEAVPVDSFSVGGWVRSLSFAAIAAAAPIVCALACAAGRLTPTFSALIGGSWQERDALRWLLGGIFAALVLLSVQAALGLVFDPRYREIPFAPLTAAVVPFLVLRFSQPGGAQIGTRAMAETVAAAVLAACAGYIAVNESFANWQAVWFCVALLGLALILVRARDAPSSE
jgi:hypothetical protein